MKTDQTVSYRSAHSQDILSIKAILFDALNDYSIAVPEPYSVADIDAIASATYVGSAFVLLRDEAVIGFFISRPIDHERIELKRLYLIASERKKGLGKFLLERALADAQNANYRFMRLETTSRFKDAVAFYRRNGFYETTGAVAAPGHDLVFEKHLG